MDTYTPCPDLSIIRQTFLLGKFYLSSNQVFTGYAHEVVLFLNVLYDTLTRNKFLF